MSNQEQLNLVLEALDNHKAIDVISLEISEHTDIADFMVISSGSSNRHLKTLLKYVVEAGKHANLPPVGVEGEDSAEWILVDLGDIIVHLMTPESRAFYELEKLWQHRP